jgi:hypothetical protein
VKEMVLKQNNSAEAVKKKAARSLATSERRKKKPLPQRSIRKADLVPAPVSITSRSSIMVLIPVMKKPVPVQASEIDRPVHDATITVRSRIIPSGSRRISTRGTSRESVSNDIFGFSALDNLNTRKRKRGTDNTSQQPKRLLQLPPRELKAKKNDAFISLVKKFQYCP